MRPARQRRLRLGSGSSSQAHARRQDMSVAAACTRRRWTERFGNCTNRYECKAACPKEIPVRVIAEPDRESCGRRVRQALPSRRIGGEVAVPIPGIDPERQPRPVGRGAGSADRRDCVRDRRHPVSIRPGWPPMAGFPISCVRKEAGA
jgi:hypothetical protein